MPTVTALQGFADITSSLDLYDVAQRLSEGLFAGIEFVEEDRGTWDGAHALRLARNFLDLEVVLMGGTKNWYTLQVVSAVHPESGTEFDAEDRVFGHLEDLLREQIGRLKDIQWKPPVY